MRFRIRGPSGQSTANVEDDATVGDLKAKITECTSLTNFDVMFGYPPATLAIIDFPSETKLSELGVKLNGEQLIVSDAAPAQSTPQQTEEATTASTSQQQAPLSLSRKAPSLDAPELPIRSHNATMVLRIMPDDNSCLFRAFNSAYFGAMDNMTELRSVIAQTIQAQPDRYSDAVLEKGRDDYCRWIQTEDAWGGHIELNILSEHFDVEICSIDVQTLRTDRYNEGRAKRCVLVYSGIHYDVIALSPSDPPYSKAYAPPEFDEKVFDTGDEEILVRAQELCKILQGQHYFTDTAAFSVKCNVCGGVFTGEKGATEHAKQTGHYDFGEAE